MDAKAKRLPNHYLLLTGGIAALLAAILFRRNIGAEVSLFAAHPPPTQVADWFALLQANPFMALAYLNFFDAVNSGLLIVVFVALFSYLRVRHPDMALLALVLRTVGLSLAIAGNHAVALWSLSRQYLPATPAAQSTFVTVGQTMLAPGGQAGDIAQSTELYGGYFLVALSGLLFALMLWRAPEFARLIGLLGLLASLLDLFYCLSIPLVTPAVQVTLGLATQPAAGLFLMLWHLLIGLQLIRLSRAR